MSGKNRKENLMLEFLAKKGKCQGCQENRVQFLSGLPDIRLIFFGTNI